jgi:hypothetical protein
MKVTRRIRIRIRIKVTSRIRIRIQVISWIRIRDTDHWEKQVEDSLSPFPVPSHCVRLSMVIHNKSRVFLDGATKIKKIQGFLKMGLVIVGTFL